MRKVDSYSSFAEYGLARDRYSVLRNGNAFRVAHGT